MRTAKKCLNNTLSITDSSLVREQISMLASNSDIISLTTSFKSIGFNSCYVRTPNRKVPPRHRNDMTQPPPGTSCQLVYLVKCLLPLFIATHPPPKQLQVYTGNFRFVACCFRFNWKTCPFGAYLAGSRAVPSRSPGSSVNIAKPCLMFWSRNPGQIRHMGANIRSMSIEHTHTGLRLTLRAGFCKNEINRMFQQEIDAMVSFHHSISSENLLFLNFENAADSRSSLIQIKNDVKF